MTFWGKKEANERSKRPVQKKKKRKLHERRKSKKRSSGNHDVSLLSENLNKNQH